MAGSNTSSKFTEERGMALPNASSDVEEMALPNAFSATFLPERRQPDRQAHTPSTNTSWSYDELVPLVRVAPDVSRADQAERLVIYCQTTSVSARIVPHTVPRVGRSCEHFPDGFELHLVTCYLSGNL